MIIISTEKRRGTVEKDARINCLLSVSVTHEGLREVAKSCIEEMLNSFLKAVRCIFSDSWQEWCRALSYFFIKFLGLTLGNRSLKFSSLW
jgi:hypothetical protein